MTLCACGHLSADHLQFEGGEMCQFLSCHCQEYRKAADSLESTALLPAGGSPEGLAPETIAEPVNIPAVNEAAERLRGLIRDRFDPISEDAAPLIDAALATERRNTVERIRERIVAGTYVDRREDSLIDYNRVMDILDEVAS